MNEECSGMLQAGDEGKVELNTNIQGKMKNRGGVRTKAPAGGIGTGKGRKVEKVEVERPVDPDRQSSALTTGDVKHGVKELIATIQAEHKARQNSVVKTYKAAVGVFGKAKNKLKKKKKKGEGEEDTKEDEKKKEEEPEMEEMEDSVADIYSQLSIEELAHVSVRKGGCYFQH